MQQLTQAELYTILRKLYPDWWFEGIEAGLGHGILQGYCKSGERVSLALKRLYDCLTSGTAPFGSVASGTLSITRTNNPGGNLLAGSVLVSKDGWKVVTTQNALFLNNAHGPVTVGCISVNKSYQANLLPGEVLAVVTANPAPLWDTSLTATVVSMAGGVPAALESLGLAKGLSPVYGESLTEFRERFRTLPDVVTPAALRRILAQTFPTAVLREGFEQAGPAATRDFYTDYEGDEGFPLEGTFQSWFTVEIPPVTVTEQDLLWLFADYGHTDFQDGFSAHSLIDGEGYDVGNPGSRTDVLRMAQAVEGARAGGVRWWIKEVS